MADTKKEQERDELHKAIWSIADDLRGSVDGWDFKSYVLGTMFYRFISENLANYINAGEIAAGNTDFDYAKMSDADAEEARAGLVDEKGFFILPSELFVNVRKRAPQDENLNETLERVFNHIEESAKGHISEDDFAGLFDDFDVNSNKLGATVPKRNEKLVKLLNGIAEMKLGDYKQNTIDAFGDAYEYLMTMYASNAGKSGGEFYTPQEVSELLTSLALRSKKELIENFINTINAQSDVQRDWQKFVHEQGTADLQTLITEEKLKPEETRKFVENAFRDGALKTTGTDIDKIMPPVSRFGSGKRAQKKKTVIEKLKGFFEKYFGLGVEQF